MKRRTVLLVLAAGVVSVLAWQSGAEGYRRWHGRSAADMMTGEHWGRYRRAMVARPSYRPLSFRTNPGRVVARSRVVGEIRAAQTSQPRNTQNLYAATRTNSGVLTEQNVYNFRQQFADGQSRKAMRSALGEPAETTPDKDVWKIQRIGLDGKPSGEMGTFEARYEWGNGGWDGSTVSPPTANW